MSTTIFPCSDIFCFASFHTGLLHTRHVYHTSTVHISAPVFVQLCTYKCMWAWDLFRDASGSWGDNRREINPVASKSFTTPSEVAQPLRSVGMVQHCDVWSRRDSRTIKNPSISRTRAVVSSSLLENAINGKNGLADTTRPTDRFQRSLVVSTACD